MAEYRPTENWLPIAFVFNASMISVRWMDFGSKTISEPFFNQTLRVLRSTSPPARGRVTNVSTLIEAAERLPPIEPAGIIFHVSRCGSTLLANALKTGPGVLVLSEAQPIGTFFRRAVFRNSPIPEEEWEVTRKLFLNAVSTIYGHYRCEHAPKLIIKSHAASILQMKKIRSVWPNVPCVILIRDPTEVMVSNLAKPGGWMRSPLIAGPTFGWSTRDVQRMSAEEFSARVIGRFCEVAARYLDANCTVLDYTDLNVENIYRVGGLFGIKLPSSDSADMQDILGLYSKDIKNSRRFEPDSDRKRRKATESVREFAERWAQPQYDILRGMSR